jgi:small-conductance mechanosensitive channel
MDSVRDILDRATTVLPILPAVIVVLLAMVAWRFSRRLVAGDPGAASRTEFRLQIAHLIIGLVTALLLLVVLPVNPQLRGQLLTLFGIVLSAAITLASTTFVGNVMAGVMLKAVRNFRSGDFVRVGEHFGRVTQRSLLSTEIQTEDRDLVTLPNLYLVTNPVKVVRASGTVISAEVSLGYDARHDLVESCLVAAAEDAGLKDPFVLVMELGDFSVVYRANGLLEEVKQLVTVRSRLRVAMLDRLHEAGVEIVSPNFMNQRVLDPETRVLPSEPPASEPPPVPTEEVAVEEIVFDKAEEAASLEQLVAEHKSTREAIAQLADPPGDTDPEQIKRKQERLTRRLAHLETLIAAKQQAVDGDGNPQA